MNIDQFREAARACTNMNALDMLWLFTEFNPPADQAKAARVYAEMRRVLVGDGQTGEVLEELPDGF